MSKTTYVQPVCRTNFLSRVNRYGVIVKATDIFGDCKIYDAVKYPEQYIAEMLLNGFKTLASIEVSQSKDSPFVTFWSKSVPVTSFSWSRVFAIAA